MELKDAVVVVTGAGSGIGAALARRFAAEGAAAVVVSDRDGDAAQRVAAEIGGTADTTDVADATAVAALVERTLGEHGRIDLFCSNAGVFSGGGVETPPDVWQQVFAVNVLAHVYAARAVLPSMLERGSGYLLNVASAAGLLTTPGDAPYTVTKHGAVAFAEWLAVTYGPRGRRAVGGRGTCRGALPHPAAPGGGHLLGAEGRRPRPLDRRGPEAGAQRRPGPLAAPAGRRLEPDGHPALGVQALQDRPRDRLELGDLLGGQGVEDVLADGGQVPGRGLSDRGPAVVGEARVGGPPVGGAGRPLDQAALLQPAHDVGQARERGVGAGGQLGHAKGPVRCLRQHREHVVVEVGQRGVAAQLAVEDAGQQLDDGDQPHPRRSLGLVQPPGFHTGIVPPGYLYLQPLRARVIACRYN
jgi:NAD(P)-dependent dehydrogenase (short-subunit alcohol dehydrogenase family)